MQNRPAITNPYVFVSYASADRERVMPVVEALRAAGVPVWLDQQGIAGGENYALEITEAIEHCAVLALLCSTASLASRNVRQEIALAWKYERPYLPLLLERVAMPRDMEYWLEASQWIEVLDRPEAVWLPAILAALASLGIVPMAPQQQEVRLVGRESALALLRDKVTAAKAGTGGLVLIGGEAGIGKTALAESVLGQAKRAECTVLEGHCFDLADTPPYGPWIDLFARFVPSVSSPPLPGVFKERGTVGAVPSQMALFVQVQDFLAALGTQRPAVILLDDLHWADPASLDLLRFLSRSLASTPLLVLVTYRSDELTRRHPLYALLPQLARDAGAARIDLGRLDDDAVRVLVAERYGLPDTDALRLVSYLQTRAEGNALFVGELLRALEESGVLTRDDGGWRIGDLTQTAVPALLRQVIEGRVARLDDDAQAALAAAAVIGQEVPFAVWAAVSGTDEDSLAGVVDHAAVSRLMEETPDGMGARFVHALIREALYEGILPSRRRRLHRAAGEALAGVPNPDADAVAHHFRAVGDARAAGWLAKAGERALLAHAYVTAVERMNEAMALLDKPEEEAQVASLLLQMSWTLRHSDGSRAIRYAEEAIKRAETANDPMLLATTRFRLGGSLVLDGRLARGLAMMRAAAADFETISPEAWERSATPRWLVAVAGSLDREGGRSSFMDVRTALAFVLATVGACEEALALIGGTLDLDDAALTMANRNKLTALYIVAATIGRPDMAKRMFAGAQHLSRSEEDWILLGIQASGFLVTSALPYDADDLVYREEVASAAEEGWTRAQALNLIAPFPIRTVRYALDFLAGDWAAAQTHAAVMQPLGGPAAHFATLTLGAIARLQGRAEDARQHVQESLPEGATTEPGTRPLLWVLPSLHLGGLVALDTDDLTAVKEWLEAHDRWLAWSGAVLGQSEGQMLWAQYYRQAGDMDMAREHAARALAHATEPRQPLALLTAHRLLGELDTETQRVDAAVAHLHASLALADACQAPYERALTLLARAELRAAMGETEAAQTLVVEVRAICEPLGAQPALARADALAARLVID